MGVEGARADSVERLIELVGTSFSQPGPFLIEVPC
jgi:hypothetical protein